MKSYEAIGVVEAQHFATALELVDEMCKTSHVQLLGAEKYLGGRLVTLIVGGSIASVTAAVEAAREVCAKKLRNPLKMSLVIPKPHAEIMKFIIPAQLEAEAVEAAAEIRQPEQQETVEEQVETNTGQQKAENSKQPVEKQVGAVQRKKSQDQIKTSSTSKGTKNKK